MPRDVRLYLDDIPESGERIARYVEGMTFEAFVADERTYDAVLRNLEIVGEAAKNVPPEFRALHPQVEWRKIAGLRDVLAHGYFGLDAETLWDAVSNKLPLLAAQVKEIIEAPGR